MPYSTSELSCNVPSITYLELRAWNNLDTFVVPVDWNLGSSYFTFEVGKILFYDMSVFQLTNKLELKVDTSNVLSHDQLAGPSSVEIHEVMPQVTNINTFDAVVDFAHNMFQR